MLLDKANNLLNISALMGVLLLLTSCSGNSSKQADELYVAAMQHFEKGEWERSLEVLSQIDSVFPDAVDVRRKVMHLRPQIVEKQTLCQLSETDSLMAIAKWRGDSLAASLRSVSNVVEGYYVSKNAPSDINSRPGVYARMSPDANFYVVVVTPGVAANAISVGGNVVSQYLPFDGERCAGYGSNYVLTFMQSECDNVAEFLSKSQGTSVNIDFLKDGRVVGHTTLSAQDVSDFAQVYETSKGVVALKLLQLRKAKLEKQLAVARSQVARTMSEGASESAE